MRTNEELLNAVRARAAEMRRERRRRRAARLGGGFAAGALMLVALLAASMPSFRNHSIPDGASAGMQASILANSGALGYAVVGILAFLLGVAATVFCVLLQRWRDEEDDGHDREH